MSDLPGEIVRHHVLGGDAVYRVVRSGGSLVDVDVIRAPGLARGSRLRFTAAAVSAMEVVALKVLVAAGTPVSAGAGLRERSAATRHDVQLRA